MITKLFLVKKTPHLTCIWVSTGEPRTPLVRVWVHNPSSCNEREEGLRAC
jgi:hypothetical protein